MMKKIIALILSLSILVCSLIIPSAASAAEAPVNCEIYVIELSNSSSGVIKGRHYLSGGATVSVSGLGNSALTAISDNMGYFEASFSYTPKKYNVSISVQNTAVYQRELDFTGVGSLFVNGGGYNVSDVAFYSDRIRLIGNKTDGSSEITFKAVEKNKSESDLLYVKAVEQTKSSSDGSFNLDFAVEKGDYTGYLSCEGLNKYNFDFTVTDLCSKLSEGFLIIDQSNLPALKNKLSGYSNELTELMNNCQALGMTTDYELLNRSVIEKFAEYAENEVKHNYLVKVPKYYKVLTELYEEARDNLYAYLSGDKEPLKVPKYRMSDITIDGKSIVASTFDGEKTEERPVFFVGYGHWETPRKELEFFPSIGTNVIQMQGVGSSIKKATGAINLGEDATEIEKMAAENGWIIDYSAMDAIKADLERAAENNVMVSVLIHPGAPSFISTDTAIKDGGGQFTNFNYIHPDVRKYIEVYARFVASELKDCEAVFDLCLTNEPSTFTMKSDYFKPAWKNWLEYVYDGDISKLNSAYNSNYSSFDAVSMPTSVEKTPLFYDWREFNDRVFADFHNWFVDIVKDEAPNLKVSCKIMQYLDDFYKEDLLMGSDYEKIAEHMDVNGCDAMSMYNVDGWSLMWKMGWYDFMTSAKDAPVWNMEDHLCGDGNVNEMDENEKILWHSSADIWNGAVHGRGGSMIWIWETRDASMPWAEENGGWSDNNQSANFAMRPKEVAKIGKATLDLNRLSNEITDIQKEDAKVGILYSRTSSGYSDKHMESLALAYESVLFSGQKVGFITDSKPSDINKYDIVIIPDATNVKEDMIDAVLDYTEKGGKLLVVDTTSIVSTSALKKDEHGKEHSSQKVNAIYNSGNTTKIKYSVESTIKNAVSSISEVVLVDSSTGKAVDDVEWSYAKHNGNIVVNVLNYDWESTKTINVLYKGEKVNEFRELREEKSFDGEIAISPYAPILLEFEDPYAIHLDLLDDNGNIIERNIENFKAGTISLRTETEGNLILALYNDCVLEAVSMTGKINIPADITKDHALKAMIWEADTVKPLMNTVTIGVK